MSKTEWKEFYRVIETNEIGQYSNILFANVENYDEAVEIGKDKHQFFKIEKYFKQVEVGPAYEYKVLFKNPLGTHLLSDGFYESEDHFKGNNRLLCFIELIQATKKERK